VLDNASAIKDGSRAICIARPMPAELVAPVDFAGCVEIALTALDQSSDPYAQVIPRKIEQ
jgi:hypothetical protein